MRRYILLSILMIVVLVLFNSCGGKKEQSGGKVTITFWHSFVSSTVPALNELIKYFEAENPGIEIKAQYVPTGDALLQKLITAIQSKTAPDISWIHSAFLQKLIEADAIYSMDQFLRSADSISKADLDDIYPALMQAATWRGTLYSIPMEATNLGIIYNKELFREAGLDPDNPPQTWDDLYKAAMKLTVDKNNDNKFDQLGFFIPVFPASGPLGDWMVWQWYPFLWQAGGHEVNLEQTEVQYNSDAGIQALALWRKLYNDLHLRAYTGDYDAAFAGKKFAMVLDGPWSLPRYRQLKNLEWGVAPLPAGPAKKATVVGGEYLVIFKQSQNPNEAWKFLRWLVKPEVQAFWSMKSGYLPIRKAANTVSEYQDFLTINPDLKAYVDQMEFGQSPRPLDYYSMEISHNIAEAIEKATVGNQDPKTVLHESAAKSNKMLQSVERK